MLFYDINNIPTLLKIFTNYQMKNHFLLFSLLALYFLVIYTPLQAQQTRNFHVNAYRTIDSEKRTKLEKLCQGFDVVISLNRINIGDQFDLTITDSNYNTEEAYTLFTIEDPANAYKIEFAIVGTDSSGDNFIQLHEADEEGNPIYEGGMVFMYADIIPDYDFWRYMRNNE